MSHHTDQRGSLHLAGIIAVVVVLAVAAIGVKVLNASHADSFSAAVVQITSPAPNAQISGYKTIVAHVDSKKAIVQPVQFYAGDKLLADAGASKCYTSTTPAVSLPPNSYAICWDSLLFTGMQQLTARATFAASKTITSLPVAVMVLHGDPVPFTVKITNPIDGASASGYMPVVVATSAAATSTTITANGTVFADAGLLKCYPTGVPQLIPNTTVRCFNSQDPAFETVSKISFVAKAVSTTGVTATSTAVTVYHATPVVAPPPPAL